eukprot:7088022-Pyramimonas_sp.AAC.1
MFRLGDVTGPSRNSAGAFRRRDENRGGGSRGHAARLVPCWTDSASARHMLPGVAPRLSSS